eukprot:TRINITY_DN119_c1_g2_i1.p6 TRINITY_DN119_c1_g2~~TRINITY_DN119_c1_g2_i1.p6  ORF type:complete len:165 (-),score=16.48 TRINITY_DN119_c1_g2_i1:769-1263(-)
MRQLRGTSVLTYFYLLTSQKEMHAQASQNEARLKQLEALLEEKNSFIAKFKSKERTMKELEIEKTKSEVLPPNNALQFTYDKVKEEKETDYCQKCKKTKIWCPHKGEKTTPKDVYALPTTKYQKECKRKYRAQEIGWRQHYDNFDTGFQKSSVCVKNFYNTGHL